MSHVTLTSRFQITIPAAIRARLRLRPGQRFAIFALDGRIVMIPQRPMRESRGMLVGIDTTVKRGRESR